MDGTLQVLSNVGHFALQLQAANLLNTPLRLYDNNERQIARNDVYGRRCLLNVTFKF